MIISAAVLSSALVLQAPNPEELGPILDPQGFEIAYEILHLSKKNRIAMQFYDLKTLLSVYGNRPPEYPADGFYGRLTKCDFEAEFCMYDEYISDYPLIISSNLAKTNSLLARDGIKITSRPNISSRCTDFDVRSLIYNDNLRIHLMYTVCDNYGITYIASGLIDKKGFTSEYSLRSFYGLGFEASREALHPRGH